MLDQLLARLGITRGSIENGKGALKAAGQEARWHAERMDSKLAELVETQKASLIKGTTRNLKLSIPTGKNQSSEVLSPDIGTYWIVKSVAYRYVASGFYAPYLLMNGDSWNNGSLFDVPDTRQFLSAAPVQIQNIPWIFDNNMQAIVSKPDKVVTDNDSLRALAYSTLVLPTIIDIQVEQYTLEPVFDAAN